MWLTPFKSRISTYQLTPVLENLESAGLLTDLAALIKKSKSLLQPPSLKDMLTILSTLTEEIWNEPKKLNLTQDPGNSTSRFLNTSNINKSQLNSSLKSPNSIIRKIELPSPRPSSQYKLQVSQDIAYMSSFSFPKGCGTFYKSRKLPFYENLETTGSRPGPGSYFCDPRTATHSKSGNLNLGSTRRLSLSLIKF